MSKKRYKVGDRVVIKIRKDARAETLEQVGRYANKGLVITGVDANEFDTTGYSGPYYHFGEFSNGLNETWLSDKLIKIEEILR